MIKKAIAPKIGTPMTIRAQIALGVEDKFLFFILTREIIDRTGQDKSSSILTICKRIAVENFIYLPHLLKSLLFNNILRLQGQVILRVCKIFSPFMTLLKF